MKAHNDTESAGGLPPLFGGDPHGWIIGCFHDSGRISIGRLAAFGFSGLILVAAAAFLDDVLLRGSVTTMLDDGTELKGMSFLGDPMVWPFCFLVPLTVWLTLTVFHRLDALLSTCASSLDAGPGPQSLGPIAHHAREILRGRLAQPSNGPTETAPMGPSFRISTSAISVAWAVALTVTLFNTVTCGLSDFGYYYPYTAIKLETMAGTIIDAPFGDPVRLPKWDCQLSGAPVANAAARIWVATFYTTLILVIAYALRAFLAVLYFSSRWHASISSESLAETSREMLISPFKSASSRMADQLGRIAVWLFFISSILVFMFMAGLFKEATPPSTHNFVLFVIAPLFPILVVIWPVLHVHRLIRDARENALVTIGSRLEAEARRLFDNGTSERFEALLALYDRTEAISAWPLHVRQLAPMTLAVATNTAMLFIEKATLIQALQFVTNRL